MTSLPAERVSVCVPDTLLYVDDGEYADVEDIAHAIETFVSQHVDEIAGLLQDIVDERRDESVFCPEDESNAPYTTYEEGKALDEYEKSHGW